MELYLVRHGVAASRRDWQGNDVDRPLTQEGREEMQRVAVGIAKMGLALDAILTSPYPRASETAEIIAKKLGMTDKLAKDDRLEYGFGRKKLREILSDHGDAQALMLVGHEPDFSKLIGKLTGGRVVIDKGGMAHITVPDADALKGELCSLLPPQVLAK
jgi:phosphohistidine phosphatase